MGIRVMCSADHPDAKTVKVDGTTVTVRDFADGCVVSLSEANGYHDSDFFATYYDAETDSFKRVMYATTRGWTYAAGASIDATPEVREKWQAHCDYLEKRSHVWRKRQRWNKIKTAAREAGISDLRRIVRLRNAVAKSEEIFDAYVRLLRTRHHDRFRSNFRKSLADQVYAWVMSDDPKFRKPLSPKQERYIF